MEKRSKKEMNRLYGKNKKSKKLRIPKTEPYKRNRVDVRDYQNK